MKMSSAAIIWWHLKGHPLLYPVCQDKLCGDVTICHINLLYTILTSLCTHRHTDQYLLISFLLFNSLHAG